MTQHVILTKGVQCCGKSTWAENFVKNNQKYKRVNRDSFRHMLSNYTFNPSNEKLVQKLWEAAVTDTLTAGYNLVIDEMHLNPDTLKKNTNFVKKICPGARIEIKEFTVSLEEAIERDKRRPFSVGEKVIRNTFKKYITDPPEQDCYSNICEKPLPPAFIFDLDGTLALKSPDRDIYDGSKAWMDDVIIPVLVCLVNLKENYKIIFLSGREDKYREITHNWILGKVLIDPDFLLYMRKTGDNRPDAIIKKEIYKEHIEPNYNVMGVFDDRPQVLRTWQNELGLFTFNVNQDVDCLNDF